MAPQATTPRNYSPHPRGRRCGSHAATRAPTRASAGEAGHSPAGAEASEDEGARRRTRRRRRRMRRVDYADGSEGASGRDREIWINNTPHRGEGT
eukprot:4494807-Pyramimonas_sp.AAC.3